jgi:hypothetical protein
MANNMSDYAENKVLELLVGKTAFSTPTAYLALYTVTPTDAGGGTQVTGGSYARVATAGADWGAAASGQIANANDIVFPEATASWGTVVAFGIFDASTAGNLIWWGPLTVQKTIDIGDTPRFVAGDIVIQLN